MPGTDGREFGPVSDLESLEVTIADSQEVPAASGDAMPIFTYDLEAQLPITLYDGGYEQFQVFLIAPSPDPSFAHLQSTTLLVSSPGTAC